MKIEERWNGLDWVWLVCLSALATAIRAVGLGTPKRLVFDEFYYVRRDMPEADIRKGMAHVARTERIDRIVALLLGRLLPAAAGAGPPAPPGEPPPAVRWPTPSRPSPRPRRRRQTEAPSAASRGR